MRNFTSSINAVGVSFGYTDVCLCIHLGRLMKMTGDNITVRANRDHFCVESHDEFPNDSARPVFTYGTRPKGFRSTKYGVTNLRSFQSSEARSFWRAVK